MGKGIDKLLTITYQPILNYFANPAFQLPIRQSVQSISVYEDTLRLVEGSDHVLSERVVYTSLSANAGVNHCHHGCWDLNEVYATLVDSSGEADHVTDHTAT